MSSDNPLDVTNVLVLPATVLGTIRYADWRGASQRSGVIGVALESLQTAAGSNTGPFFVPCNSQWKINDIQALLLRHGIKVWGVGYWNNELFFRVKKRQAHWAQYVLLRAGVPLLHGLLEGTRANPDSSTSSLPKREAGNALDQLLDSVSRILP